MPQTVSDQIMETFAVNNSLLKRAANAEEVANVIRFLASSEASYVTGSLYIVNGGMGVQVITLDINSHFEEAKNKIK